MDNKHLKIEKTLQKIRDELKYVTCINVWFEAGLNVIYLIEFSEKNPKGEMYLFEPCCEDYYPTSSNLDFIKCLKQGFFELKGIKYEYIGTEILANGTIYDL